MKNTLIVLAGALFCGALAAPLWAGEWLTHPQTLAQIRRDTSDLLKMEKEIGIYQAQIATTRRKLETQILTRREKDSMHNLIGKDKGMISDFHDEAMDEIGFMRSHWLDLTQAQKDLVSESMVDLG